MDIHSLVSRLDFFFYCQSFNNVRLTISDLLIHVQYLIWQVRLIPCGVIDNFYIPFKPEIFSLK